MSAGISGMQRKLTLEDLDRFLEPPVEAAAEQAVPVQETMNPTSYLDAAAVLGAFDPYRLRPLRASTDTDPREAVLEHLLPLSELLFEAPPRGLWTLSFSERRAALRRLATRENMRQALDANPDRPDTPVQHMFERLVDGRPVALPELSRDEIAALITGLDWVEGILDRLPDKTAVRSALAKADLLAPMRRLAGRGFVGRERELGQLDDYVFGESPQQMPLFLFGPGGVGKSTLLARFILQRLEPKNVSFAYIDIDRPTVRPDRPLTLLIEAITQLRLQLNLPIQAIDPIIKELTYSLSRQEHTRMVESVSSSVFEPFELLRQALTSVFSKLDRIVFFVDTFEEAQFLGPSIVWQVIEFLFALAESDAAFRVVISGRTLPTEFIAKAYPQLLLIAGDKSPSEKLLLGEIDRPNCPIDLGVLDEAPARELLQTSVQAAGLSSLGDDDVDAVIGIVGRNPMCLKLAARLLRDEGVEMLREARSKFLIKLKAEKIQALLYGRILHHVHGDDVRKVAYPGLIVRRISPEVIRDVLAEPCGLKLYAQRNEMHIFLDMSKEAALVERDPADGSLRHRADVRRAMLADLTDHVEPEIVERIDHAAVNYYKDKPGAVARAEEIYHRLRLCEPANILNKRWLPEAAIYLKGAGEELKARQQLWLSEKLGITLDENVRKTAGQEAWEDQAARTADQFLQSGAAGQALAVLRERSVRLPRSRLYFLEAEALRFLGRFDEALGVARMGVEALSSAGAIDMALDLLLKMVVIEETCFHFDQAEKLLDEVDAVATHSQNEILRLRAVVTRLRVQRQLRPEAREERAALRREVLPILSDQMLHKLRTYPVLLREVAAELGKEDARIATVAIQTLGMEVATDAQAKALGRAVTTLKNYAQASENAADPALTRIVEQIQTTNFDPDVIRKWVTQKLTTVETKKFSRTLGTAEPRSPILGDFREYFRAGVEDTLLGTSLTTKMNKLSEE